MLDAAQNLQKIHVEESVTPKRNARSSWEEPAQGAGSAAGDSDAGLAAARGGCAVRVLVGAGPAVPPLVGEEGLDLPRGQLIAGGLSLHHSVMGRSIGHEAIRYLEETLWDDQCQFRLKSSRVIHLIRVLSESSSESGRSDRPIEM
jgi:hypothetical protein